MFCEPGTNTLQDFIANTSDGPGFGCNVGDLEYFGVQFRATTSGPTTPTTADQITISFDGDLGFNFGNIPEVDAGSVSYLIGFNIDPAPVLTGDTISLDPPVGNVTLSAYLCPASAPYLTSSGASDDPQLYCGTAPVFGDGTNTAINTGISGTPIATISNINGTDQSSSFQFPGAPLTQIGELLVLTLNADDPASVGAIGEDPAEISATPEPAAWMLLASGLMLLTYRRFARRFR